ncbi:MAG: hypothetical protein K5761_04115 [Clostridiales bacterium]|nr:hypothetical protein [Clostridiales bacterium]
MKKSCRAVIKFIALISAVIIFLSSCTTAKTGRISSKGVILTAAKNAGETYHMVDKKNCQVIASSGLIIMYFDKTTMTVGIKDTVSGVFWSSVPENTVSKKFQYAPAELLLSDGNGKQYLLNTQDNSVAVKKAKYLIGERGVTVTYDLESSDEKVKAGFTVRYTLADGSFYVNLSMNSLDLPDDIYLEKISLMDDFGSFEKSDTDDFIFVPDGCGALIYPAIKDENFTPVSLKVYGNDKALDKSDKYSPCLVGAFGMKHGNSAFLCTIENGAEIADINAYRNSKTSLNSVGVSFNTCDSVYSDKRVVTGNAYKQEIDLCYRFLSGKSATYSGLALACRETLIRNSILSTRVLSIPEGDIPLSVNLQAGLINSNGSYEVTSDFEQTLSLMNLLKAKGVNNVILRYNGISSKANNGNADFADFESDLGKESTYNDLYNYIKTQQFSLFLETDILSAASLSDQAVNIYGKGISFSPAKSSAPNRPVKTQELLKMSALENTIDDILSSSSLPFDGYALNDMGSYLYSDYSSSDGYTRSSSKAEIKKQVPVLASYKKVMIDTGNFYAIRNADYISNIPSTVYANKKTDAYKPIPFIQLMLHGTYEYSTSPSNESKDLVAAFLKAIEYGCLPNVSWYCKESDSCYYFNNNINEVVSLYKKANDIFSDLRDKRITSHSEIQKNCYCVEYNNSAKVYVNYSNKDIKVGGITIPAKDVLKVS